MNELQITWFCLIGALLTGYAILDGFDLGIGFWYLFAPNERDRKALLHAILPYWDGNEVWLLTAGGAVFAAFPAVYASVFSGFYLALMLVLFGLIFRAVSIEFRLKAESRLERNLWDWGFALGSIVPALLFGVAAGNVLRGIPLSPAGDYAGRFVDLLNPYSLLIGVTGLAMFAAHGALYAVIKTGPGLADRARTWALGAWTLYLLLFIVSLLATLLFRKGLLNNYAAVPLLWGIPLLGLVGILAAGHFSYRRMPKPAFLASCVAIAGLIGSGAAGIFPNMVPASNDAALSLTIASASSSRLTLKTMLALTITGVPLVLAYTVWVHRLFSGSGVEVDY